MSLDKVAQFKHLFQLREKAHGAFKTIALWDSEPPEHLPVKGNNQPIPGHKTDHNDGEDTAFIFLSGSILRVTICYSVEPDKVAEIVYGQVLHDANGKVARYIYLDSLYMDHQGNIRFEKAERLSHDSVGSPDWHLRVLMKHLRKIHDNAISWARSSSDWLRGSNPSY